MKKNIYISCTIISFIFGFSNVFSFRVNLYLLFANLTKGLLSLIRRDGALESSTSNNRPTSTIAHNLLSTTSDCCFIANTPDKL